MLPLFSSIFSPSPITFLSLQMEQESLCRIIEETVIEILKTADLDTTTEYNVRTTLAERLGVDFSDINRKLLVRRAVESFLLSLPVEEKVEEETKEVVQEQPEPNSKRADNDTCRVICKLSDRRSVSTEKFGEKTLVSFRDYYQRNGKQLPSVKGISLTSNQWSAFRNSIPAIEEAIVKMKSRTRPIGSGKQIDTDGSNSGGAFAPQVEIPFERKHIEADVSNVTITFAPEIQIPNERQQGEADMSSPLTDFSPHAHIWHNSAPLIPVETIRLNGKNYYCWMHQMEFFLEQLKISYVLTEPCPSIPLRDEACFEEIVKAKTAVQKWVDDDYICCRNILNSLSDHLFDQYSKKACGAKELWQELRSAYDDDFGTKRSQVNRYIHFQMVDGISILQQVQELHIIADSINGSGTWIDEYFHVSTIVSKLPPSWKDCRAKLMREEYLPLHKLLYILRVEEESRNQCRKGESSKNANMVDVKLENRTDLMKKETKRLCYTCANEGHISKHCPRRRKVYIREQSNGKGSDVPVATEVNMVEKSVE